jgi:CRP-like cAMP-binding protein
VAALAGSPTCDKNAQAMTSAVVLEVPVDEFLSTLERQPGAAVMFIRQVAAQLHTARHNAARLVFDDCERRILKTLVDFSRTAAASPIEGSDEVTLRITHQQLALAIGVARETVSLALT